MDHIVWEIIKTLLLFLFKHVLMDYPYYGYYECYLDIVFKSNYINNIHVRWLWLICIINLDRSSYYSR